MRSWPRQRQAIAATLAEGGIVPGDVVAVTGRRSFGLIASLLGSLLAGGVILPLDPQLPGLRLRRMQSLASPRVCLCADDSGGTQAAAWVTTPCLAIGQNDGRASGLAPLGASAPGHAAGTRTPAYIFFTSGSTGDPKAVLGSHEGLAHFLAWQRQAFQVGPADRVAQLTSLSFDVMLRDVFLPLTSGGSVCLPESSLEVGSASVLAWLSESRVTLLHTVPSLAQSWLAEKPDGVHLASLRWTFFAGEALSVDLVRKWREAFPQAGGIVNLYGPTETTLVKCAYVVPNRRRQGSFRWAHPCRRPRHSS